MDEDKEAMLDAVNTLVFDDNAQRYYKALMEVAKLSPDLMIGMAGAAQVLNPLLNLYRERPAAFERVMAIVDQKRLARGWEPLTPEKPKGFDRNEYQREFMAQKRIRERRAVEIENYLRHDRDKLIGNSRLEFMRRVSGAWKKRRDQMLEAARSNQGGTLSREQTVALLGKFWEQIDAELDIQQEDAERKLRGH